ncbi:oligosaccharide flippase family protein [Bacillus sp. JJ1533]|uniref:oligosaccharide flippase family protein n=1 Tax=Bacillus sp. JJ1533 TaxID=3122959 RepID=UPI002FFF1265
MLSKHTFSYFISHGVPALISFLSIAIFSRLLTPNEYGIYALVFAIASLVNAFLFEWIKLSLLRYYQYYKKEREFLETIKIVYLAIVVITAVIGFIVIGFQVTPRHIAIYVFFTLLLSWTQSWNSLTLALVRAKLSPIEYGKLAFSRTTLGFLFGALLIYIGLKEKGLLLGILIGFWITLLFPTFTYWKGLSLSFFNRDILRKMFKYGFPLTITLLLGIVIHNSDRMIISYLLGTTSTGYYSVTYDLSEQTIFTLMMVVNLAAFPIVMKTLDEKGVKAAYERVKDNTTMLSLISIPAVAGFMMLAPNIVEIVLGEEYRSIALTLIPFIAVGAFLKGFKLYCLDIMFHIHQNTAIQIIPSLLAAIANVILTFLFIPLFGLQGAAMATVLSYLLAVVLSWVIISRRYSFPFPTKNVFLILVATLGMSLCLWPLKDKIGPGMLAMQIGIGLLSYLFLVLILNIANSRKRLRKLLNRKILKGEE